MQYNLPLKQWTQNTRLIQWIEEYISLCTPQDVHLCDGTKQEYDTIMDMLVKQGKCIRLNVSKRPQSFLFLSNPEDVARVEDSTYICTREKIDAGPTNNWSDPSQMKKKLLALFSKSMKGRTMYVIPFSMGPLDSKMSQIGVEITDSPYVVCNMYIMARMGKAALDALGNNFFIPCIHSVGAPLQEKEKDVAWPCNPKNRYIVHFPEERSIWSYGSGYGGNALLGKKCLALRIASFMAKENKWLAEHMLIMGITNPQGKKKYFAAAFPSACGKTNLAMMTSALPGWKVECVGDDIAWMKFDKEGRLRAINPEAGFFGVAPGTSYKTNPNAMKSIEKNAIFTNVAHTKEKEVWWERMSGTPPTNLIDWRGNVWHPEGTSPAAHPNARFTAHISQCPIVDPNWEDPEGVEISAIIFGGRRDNTIPLVNEAFDWEHGTFMGASVSSQTTAAAQGAVGKLRHDPFAMLPFCGYNMGKYFAHWLDMGKDKDPATLPKIFYVNWFNKNEKGEFLWPGFGENIRVLKWIFERVDNAQDAVKTPIGYLPKVSAIDTENLSLSKDAMKSLLHIDKDKWLDEVEELEKYFVKFAPFFPKELSIQLEHLKKRLD